MPFFSIIIPVYNVAPYLCECLDSVLAQTFADWEAICVDDGSTDGSGATLDEYAAKDRRFKVIHQSNAGVSAARNTALDVARGEWIGFLDADDFWRNWFLESITTGIRSDPENDWVRTCWSDWQDANATVLDENYTTNSIEVFKDNLICEGWERISRCAFPFINFYKRSIIQGVRFPELVRFREDAIFGYEMASRASQLCLVRNHGYLRRIRIGSATYTNRRKDDTVKTLSAYLSMWNRIMAIKRCRQSVEKIVKASTFWVIKDVKEWIVLCPDRTIIDSLHVWSIVIRLWKCGAISCKISGSLRYKLFLYLITGFGRLFLVGRGNPFGEVSLGRAQLLENGGKND